ncbi:galectin-4-like isoform X1 [Bemisia tabaci]|uniref:galectin-4-like isoform X1 n=2 Tax=Bemisia tabaci TaxID=7038 RepID=UPI003B281E5B
MFAIELRSPLSDVPLHLHGRPYENKFVINSKNSLGSWGNEETAMAPSLHPGDKISLAITCSRESLQISFNGSPLKEFLHRYSPSIINSLHISGGLLISRISYSTPIVSISSKVGFLSFSLQRTIKSMVILA